MKKIALILVISFLVASCGLFTSDEDRLKEAQSFFSSKQYNNSIVLLKGLLQDNGNNTNARFLLGKLYYEIGDYESAGKELSRAFSTGTKNRDVAFLQLMSHLNLKSFDKMTELLSSEGISGLLSAEDVKAFEAWVFIGAGKLAEAKNKIDESLSADPKNYTANLGLAQYYLSGKKIESALKQLDTALGYYSNDAVLNLLKAKLLVSKKKLAEAEVLLTKVIEIEPANVVTRRGLDARVTLIRTLLIQKKEDEASKVIDVAYRAAPQHPFVAYFKGYDLFRKKQFDKSRDILLKVINSLPGHKPSLLLLGTIAYEDKKFEQATSYLSSYVKGNEGNTQALKMLGVSQLRLNQASEALTTLGPVLEGGDFDVLKIAGAAAIASGDASKGAKFLESAVANNPDDLNIRIELAKAYLSMGDKGSAKKELKSAIGNKDDQASQAFSLLINLHLQEGNFSLAEQLAIKEAKKHVTSPLYPNVLGQIQARQRKYQSAEKSFNNAIKQDGKYWPASLNLAKLYLIQKQIPKADAVYTEILKTQPENETVLWDYSRYLISTKRDAEAVKSLEKMVSINNENIQAARLLIQLFNRLGEKEKGETVLANLSKSKRGKVFVQHVKGNAALQAGDIKAAIKTYENIISENPKSYVAYFDLAKAHLRDNNPRDAKSALAKSLDIKPDFLPAVALDIKVDIVGKKYKTATRAIEKLINSRPALALGYELKGDVLLAQKQLTKAATAYKASSDLSKNVGIFLKYTRTLYRAGSKSKAKKVLNAKLNAEKVENRSAIQMELLRIYKKEGKTKSRITLLNDMAEENKGNFGKLNDIAWLLHYDDAKQAEKYAAEAYNLRSDIGPISDTYGWIVLKNGKVKKALDLLTKANDLSPNTPEIQFHLAVAQFEAKQTGKAKKLFEKLQASDKNFEGKAEIGNYLKKLN